MITPFEANGFTLQESPYSDLEIYRREGVALIAMTKFKADKKAFRQASNQIDPRMIAELLSAFSAAAVDRDCRAVILASSHRVVFSRGAGIELLAGVDGATCRRFIEQAQRLVLSIQGQTTPVVAAINGLALGGGLELAMACDWRIAADRENVVLGQPEAHLGVIPGMGGTQNLPRLVGVEKATDILLNARADVTAAEALACGLVDQVVPEDELFEQAFGFAASAPAKRRVANIDRAAQLKPRTVRDEIEAFLAAHPADVSQGATAPLARSLLTFLAGRTDPKRYADGLLYEKEIFAFLQQTEDFAEGVRALVEERSPVFKAR
jgi:enoyl-CoA hydratase/carnithine racemase